MKGFRKNEEGSITLEAAVFMPFFVLFLVFLIFMIKFALTDIALNRATSETAKQIATQVYPINRISEEIDDRLRGSDKYGPIIEDLEANKEQIEQTLIDTLGEDGYQTILDKAGELIVDPVQNYFLARIVQMYLDDADRLNIIDKSKVQVISAELPSVFTDGGNKYIKITSEYEIELPIPFIERTFKMQKQASERAWLGS